MKTTNTLLIILILIMLGQGKIYNFHRPSKTVSKEKISINKISTHSITPTVKNNSDWKHSTTARNYVDTNGRNTTGLQHNVRIGKEYYISTGVTTRESSYGQRDVSADVSVTKYW